MISVFLCRAIWTTALGISMKRGVGGVWLVSWLDITDCPWVITEA